MLIFIDVNLVVSNAIVSSEYLINQKWLQHILSRCLLLVTDHVKLVVSYSFSKDNATMKHG